MEEVFNAYGKAPVVLGVAVIILIGLGCWMTIMDKKLSKLEDQINEVK